MGRSGAAYRGAESAEGAEGAEARRCLQRLEQPLVEEGVEEVAARQLRLAAILRSQPLLRGGREAEGWGG